MKQVLHKYRNIAYSLLLTVYSITALAQTISSDKNAITVSKLRVATTNEADANDPTKATIGIQYLDGLGRPLQTIGYQQSPTQKDLVINGVLYDAEGRPSTQYLPIPTTNTTGQYQNYLSGLGASFYNDTKPYTEISMYDNSPLNRPRQSFGVGQAWRTADKKIQHFDELAGSDIVLYSLDNANNIVYGGMYPAQSLYKKRKIDEQGHTSIQILDKAGRLIQSQQQDDSDYITSYYVYDDWERLRAIIQPEGYKQVLSNHNNINYNSTDFNNWVFFYNYDARGRVIEKKIPNGGWTIYVYDKRDKPVLEQSAQQATQNLWSFTKYDVFGRVIIVGELQNNTSRATLQSMFDGVTIPYENWTGYTYSSQSYPISYGGTDEKQWFLFDNYNWIASDWSFNASIAYNAQNYWSNTQGLQTGSYARSPEDPSKFFHTIMHYDNKGRVMQTYQTHHRGGSQPWQKPIITNFQYNFAGEVITVKITYQFDNQSNITTLTSNEVDIAGRLLKVYHGINGIAPVEILRMTYDEIGRLSQKKIMPYGTYYVGGTLDYINRPPSPNTNIDDVAKKAVCLLPGTLINGSTVGHYSASINPNASTGTAINGLQTMDYQWHIRGGLRGINLDASQNPTPNLSEGDLFSFKLDYETSGQWSGNIGKQSWQNVANNELKGQRRYTYTYYASSYLRSANFFGGGAEDFSLPLINYDKNGNITFLQRNGKKGTSFGVIDILSYVYNGNQVQSVSDLVSNNEDVGDFRDIDNGTGLDYTYYADGSLKSDANEKIQNIIYDTFLKQPIELQLTDGRKIKHYYDGGGFLYKTVYLSTNSTVIETWEFLAGGLILKDGQPYQMPIPDGRAVYIAPPSGAGGASWQYEFDYKDHLGNTRVSFKVGGTPSNGNQLEKTAESSFDPWGVKLSVGVTNAVQNRWEMQGHEKESTFGLNRINYGNRTMNPLTGIFDRADKFAEKYVSLSPFQVSANNPIRFLDVNGDSLNVMTNDGVYHWQYNEKNGYGFYNNEGNMYAGNDKFINSISTALSRLSLNKEGGEFINELSSMSENITLQAFKRNVTDGSSIGLAPDLKVETPTASGMKESPFYITLGHELAHAYSNVKGAKFDTWVNIETNLGQRPLSTSEIYASHYENIFRSSDNLPLRTHYSPTADGGVVESTRLIDSNNRALYFNIGVQSFQQMSKSILPSNNRYIYK